MNYESLGLDEKTLRELYSNPDFNGLIKKLDETNPAFFSLPNDQKKLALALVLQGNINSIEGLWRTFYKRRVPSIQEFLTPDYIGSTASFYPESSLWRNDLSTIFDDSSSIYEWVLSGSIGIGKTTVAMLAQFYNLFRVTSLRYPQLAMGSGETKPLALLLITVSKMKAQEMIQNMRVFIKSCKYFVKVTCEDDFIAYQDPDYAEYVPYYESKVEGFPRINFPNNIYIGTGSNLSHTIGSDIFGVILDEAEFRGKSAEKAFDFYSELIGRVISRFLKTKFKLICLASSVKQETGVIATHIKNLQAREDKNYHHISSYSIWEIKPDYLDAFEKYGHFWVFKGTKSHPSRVLTKEEGEQVDSGSFYIPESCKLVRVPAHPQLVGTFNTSVERALRDQAGEFSSGGERPFDDLSTLEDKVLVGEIEFEAPLHGGLSLFEQLPITMFAKTPDGLRLKRYANAKRYIHLDLADSGEGGVCMVHKEINSYTGHIVYVIDFIAKITSPNRISFKMIEDFLFDLKKIGNVLVQKLTADQYQSVSLLQTLEVNKYAPEVKKQEMGTKSYPFNEVSTLMGEDSVKVGLCPTLKSQMKGIYFIDDSVEYETERKDMVDAFVGAIYAAKWNILDVPVNIYYSEHPADEFKDIDDIFKDFKKL